MSVLTVGHGVGEGCRGSAEGPGVARCVGLSECRVVSVARDVARPRAECDCVRDRRAPAAARRSHADPQRLKSDSRCRT